MLYKAYGKDRKKEFMATVLLTGGSTRRWEHQETGAPGDGSTRRPGSLGRVTVKSMHWIQERLVFITLLLTDYKAGGHTSLCPPHPYSTAHQDCLKLCASKQEAAMHLRVWSTLCVPGLI